MTNDQMRALVDRCQKRDVQLTELQAELDRIMARVAELGRIKDRLMAEVHDDETMLAEGYGHGV